MVAPPASTFSMDESAPETPTDEPGEHDPEQPQQDNDNDAARKYQDDDDDDGTRLYLCLSLIVCIVGITIIVIMLTVVKDDDNDNNNNSNESSDPPPAMLYEAQDRLDLLLEAVQNNTAARTYITIPTDINALMGVSSDASQDAVTRATGWVVHDDRYPAQRELVDRFALAVLYYHNGGGNWVSTENWLGDDSVCTWAGITCCEKYYPGHYPHQCADKSGHELVELDLKENGLNGDIHAATTLLESCEILWLNGNRLTGSLDPLVFGSMPHLDALYVHHNELTGNITNAIRDNGHLDTLFTHGNEFSGDWPEAFCPNCLQEDLCTSLPVAYTLDCDEMDCPTGCCTSSLQRTHCISDGTPEDEN